MSKTILVVDDEVLIAIDMQTQLEELGHRVLLAATLDEALALVDRERIDVAIVDWHLRDEISAPLVEMLTQRGVPFVLCSGTALEELATLFPATPILTKPFASDHLLEFLGRVVGDHSRPSMIH